MEIRSVFNWRITMPPRVWRSIGSAAFHSSMLGLWKAGPAPHRISLHVAFKTDLQDVLDAPRRLRSVNIEPLDFGGNPCDQAVVLAWMPAAVVYFRDPDGNLLEFLAMLPDPPRPVLGVVGWTEWMNP